MIQFTLNENMLRVVYGSIPYVIVCVGEGAHKKSFIVHKLKA